MATTLTRWDPFRDLVSIQDELNRLFGKTYAGSESLASPGGSWIPALDVYETKDRFVVTAELAGIDPKDVEVSVEDSTLTIAGHRSFYSDVNDEQFHRVERRFGSFTRSVTLPSKADPEKIEARFDKGVLTVDLPKSEAAKARKIAIKAGG